MPSLPPPARREFEAAQQTGEQIARALPLPAVPVILLSGTRKNPEFPGNPLEQDLKLQLHRDFVARVPGAEHVLVPESRHVYSHRRSADGDRGDSGSHFESARRASGEVTVTRCNPWLPPAGVAVEHVDHAEFLELGRGELADRDVEDATAQARGDGAEDRARRLGRHVDHVAVNRVVEPGQQQPLRLVLGELVIRVGPDVEHAARRQRHQKAAVLGAPDARPHQMFSNGSVE